MARGRTTKSAGIAGDARRDYHVVTDASLHILVRVILTGHSPAVAIILSYQRHSFIAVRCASLALQPEPEAGPVGRGAAYA